MGLGQLIFIFLRSVLRNQAELAAENLALRQQLAAKIAEPAQCLPRTLAARQTLFSGTSGAVRI